ncbi:MAG: hypothetical protein QOE96_3555, partial [Blastocatellia bacterium]|nr:hypothetical protein [Blastocatellia bacterium]
MCRLGLLAAFILGSFVFGFSQSQSGRSSITGRVQDQAGATIVGARVQLSAPNFAQQSTTTDQSGNFQFKTTPSGKYQVQVNYEGFDPVTIDVTVGSVALAPLQVVLAIASLRQETTVTSTPAQISTEAGDNKDTVALSEQTLSNLPVFDQDYVGAMSRFLD